MNNKKIACYLVLGLSSLLIINSGVPNKSETNRNTESKEKTYQVPPRLTSDVHSKNVETIIVEKDARNEDEGKTHLNQIKAANMEAYLRAVKMKSMSTDDIKKSMNMSDEERKSLAREEVKKVLIEHLAKK